jgi:hypothetical protein
MGENLDFWRKSAKHARVGAAAFANDWQWFTGVPLASAIGTYIAARRGSDLTTGYPILDGVIAAAVAFLITWAVAFVINIWREAPKLYLSEKKRADDLQAELALKHTPNLIPSIEGTILGVIDGQALCVVNVTIKNTGIPSIVDNYRLTVRRNGQTHNCSIQALPDEKSSVSFGFAIASSGPPLTLRQRDFIYEKATTRPIPTGSLERGWLFSLVPGLDFGTLSQSMEGTIIELSCRDILGKQYSCNHIAKMSDISSPKYTPGAGGAIGPSRIIRP